jgi:hypothetical protein
MKGYPLWLKPDKASVLWDGVAVRRLKFWFNHVLVK